jgi:hypothetical protein
VTVIKWVADRLLRLIPESLLGRILPGPFRFDASALPPASSAPDAALRVYLAPVNYAGQAWQWGRALERHHSSAGAVNLVVRTARDFRHPADQVVPLGVYAASRRWQRDQRAAILGGFTHVVIEAQRQPFGALLDESVARQAHEIRRAGLGVVMVCHGTDIRLPSRHAARDPESPFRDALRRMAPRLERIAARNARILRAINAPVLVTTPDLLLDVPGATWLPSVVDAATWATSTPVLERARPVVAHAPSSGPVKGSEAIDRVLGRLDDEGLIEYRRIQGVPFERMPEFYGSADIVVDQIRLGIYSVASLEAMAAGRVVIAYLDDHTRSVVREDTGWDIPIASARAAELEAVVRGLVADRDAARSLAAAGVRFVADVHDGRRTAQVLGAALAASRP